MIHEDFPSTSGAVFPMPYLSGTASAPKVSAVLAVVDQVPEHLLQLDPNDYATFVREIAALRSMVRVWEQNPLAPHSSQSLLHIRQLLSKCPDDYPPPSTSELAFIPDADLREVLRLDIAAVERALSTGEWKGATVLAGSIVEALLLWKLEDAGAAAVSAGIAAARAAGTKGIPTNERPLDEWHLHELSEVASHLQAIKPETIALVRVARGYRNLIHPGRAQRLGQRSDRGTALATVAALEHVVKDFS